MTKVRKYFLASGWRTSHSLECYTIQQGQVYRHSSCLGRVFVAATRGNAGDETGRGNHKSSSLFSSFFRKKKQTFTFEPNRQGVEKSSPSCRSTSCLIPTSFYIYFILNLASLSSSVGRTLDLCNGTAYSPRRLAPLGTVESLDITKENREKKKNPKNKWRDLLACTRCFEPVSFFPKTEPIEFLCLIPESVSGAEQRLDELWIPILFLAYSVCVWR